MFFENWNLGLSFLCISYLNWNTKNNDSSITSLCSILSGYPWAHWSLIVDRSNCYVYSNINFWSVNFFKFDTQNYGFINL